MNKEQGLFYKRFLKNEKFCRPVSKQHKKTENVPVKKQAVIDICGGHQGGGVEVHRSAQFSDRILHSGHFQPKFRVPLLRYQ